MRVPVRFAAALGLILTAVAAAGGSSAEAAPKRIPLLREPPGAIDRDLPAAVKERLFRYERSMLARVRRIGRQRPTRALGCRRADFGELGPRAPQVAGRLLGHHVEIVVSYASLPRAAVCRPYTVTIGIIGADRYAANIRTFELVGRRGRVVLELPLADRPPYTLQVSASTLQGRRSVIVKQPLRCPGTSDRIRGCLRGDRPWRPGDPVRHGRQLLPKPILPIRRLSRAMLEATLRYLLEAERRSPVLYAVPRDSRCPTLRVCEVTYADAAFPNKPYRVRYAIAGEQVPGCWMGVKSAILDHAPYSDAFAGQRQLAACASWL